MAIEMARSAYSADRQETHGRAVVPLLRHNVSTARESMKNRPRPKRDLDFFPIAVVTLTLIAITALLCYLLLNGQLYFSPG